MGKSSAPPAPDYTPIANALQSQTTQENAIAQQQMAWAQQAYADNLAQNQPVEDALTAQMTQQTGFASELQKQYETNIMPLEAQIQGQAEGYATPGSAQQEQLAGAAGADVGQQFDAARNANLSQLESYGINPNATRFAALDLGARTQEAAAVAGAQNTSRLQTTAMGLGMEQGAANLGATLPGAAAGTQQGATTSGSTAVNTGLATTASGANTMGTAPQYYGLGTNGLGVWGNTLNQGYQNQAANWQMNNANMTGFGQLFGTVAGAGAKGYMSTFAKGGSVQPPADDDFVALSRVHPDGHLMEPHETIRHYHITGGANHLGNFKSPEEAHRHTTRGIHGVGTTMPHSSTGDGSDTPQRQDYEKFWAGGRAAGYEKFDLGGGALPMPTIGGGLGGGQTSFASTPAASMSSPSMGAQPTPPPMSAIPTSVGYSPSPAQPVQTSTPYSPPAAQPSQSTAIPMQQPSPNFSPMPQSNPDGNQNVGGAVPSWGSPYLLGGQQQYFAVGGSPLPPGYAGQVPTSASPSMGRTTDDIPAALNADEFVIPKDVAKWKGEEFFQNLITKSRQSKIGAPAKPSYGRGIPGRGQ